MNDHSDGFYCCAECHSDMRFVNQHARDHEEVMSRKEQVFTKITKFHATLIKER